MEPEFFPPSLTYKNPVKLCTLDIFTDGSKAASRVGYAVIIINSNSIYSQISSGRLHGYASPYDAVAFALERVRVTREKK